MPSLDRLSEGLLPRSQCKSDLSQPIQPGDVGNRCQGEEQQTKPPCRARTTSGAAAHDAHNVLVHPWNELLLVFCNEDGALQPGYWLQHVVPNLIVVESNPATPLPAA